MLLMGLLVNWTTKERSSELENISKESKTEKYREQRLKKQKQKQTNKQKTKTEYTMALGYPEKLYM